MMRHRHSHTIAGHGTLPTYVAGYVLAMLLTLAAFGAVMLKLVPPGSLGTVIAIAAVAQAMVHMWFFLHMFRRNTPVWNTVAFAFTLLVIVLLIAGSLFILLSANQNMMLPTMPMDGG